MKAIKPVSEVAEAKRSKYFPLKIASGIVCEVATDAEIDAMLKKYYYKVFDDGFENQVSIKPKSKQANGIASTRAEYRKIHKENFIFKVNGKTVGWTTGEMEDFETFYMRNTGIIPAYQNKKIYSRFLKVFIKYITDIGYQRISSQHAGWDSDVVSYKMKQGFVIVGSENSDRWGSLIKLVKFTDPKREKKYRTLF